MMQVIIHAVVVLPVAKLAVIQALAQVAMKVIIYTIINVKVVVHHALLAVARQIHAQCVIMDTIYHLKLVKNVMMNAYYVGAAQLIVEHAMVQQRIVLFCPNIQVIVTLVKLTVKQPVIIVCAIIVMKVII